MRVTVNRPVEEIYAFWHDFQNLPRVMEDLDSVEVSRNGRAHWKASAPTNIELDWETEIVEDIPNERITWRSVDGTKFKNEGSLHFSPALGDRGTEVSLSLDFDPPGGILGDAAAKMLQVAPPIIANKALHRFKALMETGEIPTTRHQPAARNNGRDE